ncbi:transcription termination/antitermination factor NusG [bacterium]|nr:transcription termination/antitermination factor NusG [bacterium]
MRWYVLHVLSGYEEKVANAITHMMEYGQLGSDVTDIVVPCERKLENVRGKRKTTTRKIFPGYILVQMTLDNSNRYLLRQVQGVIDFVKSADNPQPLTEDEVNQIFGRMGKETAEIETSYNVGDTVKVLSGPFAEAIGKVREIEPERHKVKIMVSIFGRDTQVELDFEQVELFDASKSAAKSESEQE